MDRSFRLQVRGRTRALGELEADTDRVVEVPWCASLKAFQFPSRNLGRGYTPSDIFSGEQSNGMVVVVGGKVVGRDVPSGLVLHRVIELALQGISFENALKSAERYIGGALHTDLYPSPLPNLAPFRLGRRPQVPLQTLDPSL